MVTLLVRNCPDSTALDYLLAITLDALIVGWIVILGAWVL